MRLLDNKLVFMIEITSITKEKTTPDVKKLP